MNFFKSVVSTSILLATLLSGNALFAQTTVNNSQSPTEESTPQTTSPASCQYTSYNIPEAKYQSVYDNYAKIKDNRPTWVDGFEYKGKTYYNVIFNKCYTKVPWVARHGLTSQQYQQAFNEYKGKGYRLYQVDSYLRGDTIYYAAIFVKDTWPAWAAYHGQTSSQFQTTFDQLTKQGYRLVNFSTVKTKGTVYYTSLYDKKSVGKWYAKSGLTSTQYQQEFDNYTKQGLKLAYLNAYYDADAKVAKYSAIWNSESVGSWYSSHKLTSSQYKTKYQDYTKKGYYLRLVTGYQDGTSLYFGGLWTTKQ